MKILSIGKEIIYDKLEIVNIKYLSSDINIDLYDYMIISGGDGMIRRVLKECYHLERLPRIILNPIGSFNVIAKMHRVDNVFKILEKIERDSNLKVNKHNFFSLNSEIFLFSAGNMGDLQHIMLSETLRFGIIKNGLSKYLLSVIFLFPVHIVMTPFMLLSSKRFFIFTPFSFIRKFGSFYGKVDNLNIDLDNDYNLIELDGDIVMITDRYLKIEEAGVIDIIVS